MSTKTQDQSWYLIDAQQKTLGRLATYVGQLLQGKQTVSYLPYLDNGNYIIIINAQKIRVTGDKVNKKMYYKHSGKPGQLKQKTFLELQYSFPQEIIKIAIKGMLPKNLLSKQLLKKLKIYPTETHPHTAQKPQFLEI